MATQKLTHDEKLVSPENSAPTSVVESSINTKDGVQIEYRLEECEDPEAPLILLSNCVLVDYGIWDYFVKELISQSGSRNYRILRYNTRGRHSVPNDINITLDLLASDIVALLDAVGVKQAAAVIGVSLGGVTTLNASIMYPNRIAKFIVCDTSSISPPQHGELWDERVQVCEMEGTKDGSGQAIVGEYLADATVSRWFTPAMFDEGLKQKEAERVKEMVKNNSLAGFRASIKALYEYDLREKMAEATVPGLFVVGDHDGVLPQRMKEMTREMKGGRNLDIVKDSGHLPMVEQPKSFTRIVLNYLG